MNLHALYHEPKSSFAYAYKIDELHLRFRCAKDDLDTVTVIHGNKFAWLKTKTRINMEKIAADEYFDYYQCSIVNADSRHAYYFELVSNTERLYYTEAGIVNELDDTAEEYYFFVYPNIAPCDVLSAPDWMKSAIFYQIFVDSFAKGPCEKIPDNLAPWEETAPFHSCHGGNLPGITEHLPYLEELGVNAIYLTPIFYSDSSHKYNTYDYQMIDPYFGTEKDLKKLVETAHSLNIRVVLDAVFNHCGMMFAPFQDVVKHGKKSSYWNWFFIEGEKIEFDPVNYRSFSFGKYMPKLNTRNKEVMDYLITTAVNWTKQFELDGWRLDVADEVDHDFWREFRKKIKEVNKEACIIGETWHTATAWLKGDQFDSVMNYPLTKLMLDFFARSAIDASTFASRVNALLMRYPNNANEVTLNFLDSHDTPRFLYSCKGELFRLQNAAAFLFAYLGMPCIYYGTEIGMSGGNDPDCRRGFLWNKEKWNMDLFCVYQNLIKIRKLFLSDSILYGSRKIVSFHELLILFYSDDKDKGIIFFNQTNEDKKIVLFPQAKEENQFSFEELLLELDVKNIHDLYITTLRNRGIFFSFSNCEAKSEFILFKSEFLIPKQGCAFLFT